MNICVKKERLTPKDIYKNTLHKTEIAGQKLQQETPSYPIIN